MGKWLHENNFTQQLYFKIYIGNFIFLNLSVENHNKINWGGGLSTKYSETLLSIQIMSLFKKIYHFGVTVKISFSLFQTVVCILELQSKIKNAVNTFKQIHANTLPFYLYSLCVRFWFIILTITLGSEQSWHHWNRLLISYAAGRYHYELLKIKFLSCHWLGFKLSYFLHHLWWNYKFMRKKNHLKKNL